MTCSSLAFKVLAGGRGRGHFVNYPKGGVQLVYSPEEVEECAKGMVGDFLITKHMIFGIHIIYI